MKKTLKLQNKYRLIGLDTNIFIYYFQEHSKWGPVCREIILSVVIRKNLAITSTISLLELLSFRTSPKQLALLKEEFLSIPNLELKDTNKEIAIEAAEIRRKYKFGLADAIQLATAKLGHAQAFITNDDRLNKFKELKVLLLKEI